MTCVLRRASSRTRPFLPVATISPFLMAIASTVEFTGSTVEILPLCSTRSGPSFFSASPSSSLSCGAAAGARLTAATTKNTGNQPRVWDVDDFIGLPLLDDGRIGTAQQVGQGSAAMRLHGVAQPRRLRTCVAWPPLLPVSL